jgi:chemotaxis protein methyltransferase CheR
VDVPVTARIGPDGVADAAASATAAGTPAASGEHRLGALAEKVRADTQVGGLERIEIELLLEGIHRHYGFDFRSYAYSSIKRRLWRRVHAEGLETISALQERVLHDPPCMDRLMLDLSINVTAMFRDPTFFLALRRQVIPLLRTYPFLRIWHAGCSTGEEVYSMAILLQEEGLYKKTRVYATDINEAVLTQAKRGIFPLGKMQEYTTNYLRAGGTRSFSEYYTAKYDGALFHPSLMDGVVFSQHNLVTDRSFSEFNLILCRNVMIYFDRPLQNHVLQLFRESLANFGVLGLGKKESLKFTAEETNFEPLVASEKIYRKAVAP